MWACVGGFSRLLPTRPGSIGVCTIAFDLTLSGFCVRVAVILHLQVTSSKRSIVVGSAYYSTKLCTHDSISSNNR